jgi:amidohydrolase
MPNPGQLKGRAVRAVDARQDQLVELARTLHQNPEIAFQEHQSAALLADALADAGFDVQRGAGGLETAFVATLHGAGDGPTVAFLAEYDALPELGHACGHNLIGTAAIGAGLAMQAVLPHLDGTIQVIGTPAEEGGGGKVYLVDAGLFDDVDAAMMFHPSNRNMTRRTALSAIPLNIEFFGKAAHAASVPDKGINALDALILTFNSINALRQHLRDDARIHGIITHGGAAANIVPDYTAANFLVRAADMSYTREVLDKVRACAEAGARATGARLEFQPQEPHYEPMLPNPKLADLVDDNMKALGLEVQLPAPDERMGSTDMGNVSQAVPALHPYVAIGPQDLAGHTVEFREASGSPVGYRAMQRAAQFMAMTAIDLLAIPENMQEVKVAFEEQKSEA